MRYLSIILLFFVQIGLSQNPQFIDISESAGTILGGDNNGIVVGDFNGDGFEDFFVPCRLQENKLMQNNGDGTFSNVIANSGIGTDGLTMTAVWGDIDNDGDLDLFVANYYTEQYQHANHLYINDGTGNFQDISSSAGVETMDKSRSVHMCDVDYDGLIDIYVCNISQENILWHNNGDNTFSNYIAQSGLGDTQVSMGAMFFDYDGDGDQDLYLTHDAYQANILYENDGSGVFLDKSIESNLNYAGQGMGVDHGDINNDGHLDVYVTNLGQNCLFVNDGSGQFTNIAESAGVDDVGMGWGCFFIDYDNDGWEDIYIINDSNFSPESNKLYRNNGDLTFTEVGEGTPLDSFYVGIGGAWMDFDNNGYQDIIVANTEESIGVQVFMNEGSQNNWISFNLIGNVCKDAYGTRIEFQTSQGIQIDEKTGGSGYASQNSHRLHFGLGNQSTVEEIYITWPDGEVEFLSSLAVNQVHTIEQGQNPLGMNGLSNIDLAIYPNPYNSFINISGETNFNLIEVYSVRGKLIHQISNKYQLSNIGGQLSPGIYYFRIWDEEDLLLIQKVLKY